MHRFFVPPQVLQQSKIVLPEAVSRQLASVLRARPGEQIALLDNTGAEYHVEIASVSAKRTSARLVSRIPPDEESGVRINLYQGLLKESAFDWILQKATELGVARITPILFQRSVVKVERPQNQMQRWARIIQEAAEQSGRTRLPELGGPLPLHHAIDDASGLLLVPWEEEKEHSLKAALAQAQHKEVVSIFIGPEGGITKEEAAFVASEGAQLVSLGKRILRAETAGVAALAAVMYELGELG